ncbi:MAG: GNAT family N-acetyltransferase [Sedimentisphaerales bacterium]|nr:GNAT family N-acetyltransferase [Sedimentisphaerales bacterium]
MNDTHVILLKSEHAELVAQLHQEGIPTGFLSSLGTTFLTELYRSISQSSQGFGFVVCQKGRVVGFVAFTTNLRQLYRTVLRGHGIKLIRLLLPRLFSIETIKKIFQNIFYPGKTKKLNLPDAELLSIAVSSSCRGKGLAGQLISCGFDECRRRGIHQVKVLVAEANQTANRLYQKNGFKLVTQLDSHGCISNIYVAQTNSGMVSV